jgi:predicted ribosome quality control (RQC) complex YloA/Tae2 family protein
VSDILFSMVSRDRVRLFEYVLPGGWNVRAGKTDADNECLSLRIAGPDDYWFHAHGLPGSHVVLEVPEGQTPDRETLKRAAAIAAYHSKARAGGVVPVTCTQARHVSKPRGARVGTVEIRKETTIKVRPGLPLSRAPDSLPVEGSGALDLSGSATARRS